MAVKACVVEQGSWPRQRPGCIESSAHLGEVALDSEGDRAAVQRSAGASAA